MRIVAPISRVDEVAPLAAAGADEFYCGIVPPDWTEKFNSSGVNRRFFGNLSSYDDLQTVLDQAHGLGRTVSLVMNAQHYAEDHIEPLLTLAARTAAMGVDSLIVGDIGLLSLLAAEGPKIRLHASSLLSCRNSEAAGLYRQMGARRVIFPRDVTLGEMAKMMEAVPEMEFEAFILNDGCVFEEGSCHTIHLPGRLGGPICIDRYQDVPGRVDGRELSDGEMLNLADNDARYQEWLWYRFSCGFALTDEGYPFGPCGICAMPFMAARRLTAVKVAGREGATPRKVKSVEMVRLVRDRLDEGEAAVMDFARQLRGRPELCSGGFMCYYREVLE